MKNFMKKATAVLLMSSLVLGTGCASESSTQDSTATMQDGVYEGQAEGRFGTITVSVTVSDHTISDVEVTDHHDSAGISELPIERIPSEIVEYQSLGVDTVTGATLTSYGIINATANALEQSGADVSALKNVEVTYEDMPVEDVTTEVLVVGSGMAGLVAAASAASEGADVTIVEKLPYLGGTLILAGGYLVNVDGEHADESLDTSLERVVSYYKEVNSDSVRQPDYDFFSSLAATTGEAIDFLIDEVGADMETFDAGNVVMSHDVNHGAGLVSELKTYLESKNVNIITDTEAKSVLMEDGKAVGVNVENRSGSYTIHADKVIFATGGATYDTEAVEANNPELETINLVNEASVGATGDGFRILEEAGAQMGDGPYIKSEVPTYPYAFHMSWYNTPNPGDKLIIDAEGKRFTNENPMLNYMLNTYLLRHESSAYYVIYDVEHTDEELLEQIKEIAESDSKYSVVYAENISELADKLEMDADTLTDTFDTYQAACEKGVDEEYGKDADHLIAYNEDEGLYAIYLSPTSLGTIGGAMTDEAFHVLNTNGDPIENLFAVGEVATSTLFGDYYVGSFSLGLYTAAGKIAGETAVNELQ